MVKRPLALALSSVVALGVACFACAGIIGVSNITDDPPFPETGPFINAYLSDSSAADAAVDVMPPAEAGFDAPVCDGSFTSDPNNCGSCGHSCQGGACDAGACQPSVLASSATSLQNLAVGSGSVFYTVYASPGSVMAVPVAGGASVPLTASEPLPQDVVVNGTNVYFTDVNGGNGVLKQMATDGGGLQTVATETGFPYGLSVSAATGDVLFSTYTSGTYTLHADTPMGLTNYAVTPGQIFAIASNATAAYFTDEASGYIVSLTFATGSTGAIATGLGQPRAIAESGGVLYFFASGVANDRALLSLTLGQTTPVTLVSGLRNPQGLVVDPANIYYDDANDGTAVDGGPPTGSLYRLPVQAQAADGGPSAPQVIASGQPFPAAMAQDGSSVYWINQGPPSTVMKLAK